MCADTSKLLWLNIPIAFVVIFGIYWLSSLVDIRAKSNAYPSLRKRLNRFSEESNPDSPHFTLPVPPTPANKSGDKWREQVGSPVVEHAWETLCGSIIQEVRALDSSGHATLYAVLSNLLQSLTSTLICFCPRKLKRWPSAYGRGSHTACNLGKMMRDWKLRSKLEEHFLPCSLCTMPGTPHSRLTGSSLGRSAAS